MTLITLLPFLNALAIVLGLGLTVGAFVFAVRGGYSKEASSIQKQVIESLSAQNEAQARQIEAQEREIGRKTRILETVKALAPLKRRGLHIEINGTTVILVDEKTGHAYEVQVKQDDDDDK